MSRTETDSLNPARRDGDRGGNPGSARASVAIGFGWPLRDTRVTRLDLNDISDISDISEISFREPDAPKRLVAFEGARQLSAG